MVQRRKFIQQLAAGSIAVATVPKLWGAPLTIGKSDKFGDILPTRPLGKTGEELTIYCMGGWHIANTGSDKTSQAILERGMELGCRFYENAWVYSEGKAEELYGKYLIPKYRDQIFLATKNDAKNAEDAKKQLESSLRRLGVDQIDLYYMHAVKTEADVDGRLTGGVLEVMLEAQQKGQVKHLGFSGHHLSEAHRRLMKHVAGNDPFVAVQFPVNPIDAGKPDSFVKGLIPELLKRNYGLMGMKPMAGGGFHKKNTYNWETDDPIIPNYLSLEEVLWFNLSQPITSMVCGTDRLEQVDQNIGAVESFASLSLTDQEKIIEKISKFAMTERLEYYRPKPGTYS